MDGRIRSSSIFFYHYRPSRLRTNLRLILNEDQILRLNFESDIPLPMDDVAIIDDLITRADRTFTHKSAELMKFFNIQQE